MSKLYVTGISPLFARLSLLAVEVFRRPGRPWCESIRAAARFDDAADWTLVVDPNITELRYFIVFI